MFNKRLLVFYSILAIMSAALQAMPCAMGDAFVFAAVLGGFPIYTAASLNWASGLAVYLAAAYITSIIGISEALFFICTNGIIGLSLGIMKEHSKSIYTPPALSALIVLLLLSAVNNIFDISIFGYSPLRTPLQQALILFTPLYIYCLIFFRLAMSADRLLHKYIELNIH